MDDILIRMEIPKTCSQCPMCYDYMMCKLNHFAFWNTNEPFDCCDERLAGCPLVELPEHGDLIDRGEIKTNMVDEVLGNKVSYVNMEQIKNAPVVIPSNKEDAE